MRPETLKEESRIRIGVTLLLLALLAVGFWLRVRHLGDLGLVVDEGNQVLAVQGILKHGIPKVDSGRIYSRGIPFLYAEAAAAKLFGLNEFSLRLPGVLFGVAAILAAYLLGRRVFNRPTGLLMAALLTFSVWEIEMSRYARFYTAFQFTYLIGLVCFYRGFMLEERAYKFWFIVTAFFAFSLHELGVMLATCFLIPLFSSAFSSFKKWVFGVLAAGLAGLWSLYPRLLNPLKAMADPIPYADREGTAMVGTIEGIMTTIKGRFHIPKMNFIVQLAHDHPIAFLGLVLAPGVVTAYLVYRFYRKGDGWQALFAVPIIWAAFIHQFGLVLIMLIIYLAFFARDLKSLTEPALKAAYGVIVVCLVFWVPVLAANTGRKISLIRVLFDYPNVYKYFLYWFVNDWLIMTAIVGLGCVVLAARFISDRTAPAPLFVLGAIFIPVILTSFLPNEFYEARYTFHLYPLIVMVFAVIVVEAGSRIIKDISMGGSVSRGMMATAIALLALFISQDANPADAWLVGNRTYQSVKDPIKGHINWKFYAGFHQDHKTPGLYVREHLRSEDTVVAVGPPHMIAVYHYYVGRVDYSVAEQIEGFQFRLKGGKISDHVTGSRILDSLPLLMDIIERDPGRGIWLLCDRMLLVENNHYFSEPMKEYLLSLARDPIYLGLDGQTFVVKVR
jgi:hypothetical protein